LWIARIGPVAMVNGNDVALDDVFAAHLETRSSLMLDWSRDIRRDRGDC